MSKSNTNFSIEAIAMQQVVNDGTYHTCMICGRFQDKECSVVEQHLIKGHTRILALIAKEQKLDE